MSGLRVPLLLLLILTLGLTTACDDDKPPAQAPGEDIGPDVGDLDREGEDMEGEVDAEPRHPEEMFPDLDHPPEDTLYDFAGSCVSLGLVLEKGRRRCG